ncbi:MAG: helix-turn-helix domain-containing protein [Candidatus Doudnabacteria bacterium]|nr:helix-turn-helix domain-containing protein [Candidatus Doudnabacteria bacterium]
MLNHELPIYKSLIRIGFSDKEIVIYLALLELGKRTVSAIARKAGINRTTVYDILESLISKRLVSISGKEPLQEYVAESPDNILNMLRDELAEKQGILLEAQNLVPQLKSMHNVSNRPKITFYEGSAGLEHVYDDTLTSHEPIRGIANVNEMHAGLPKYFPKYYKRRAQRGLNIKAILSANEEGRKISANDKEELRDTAFIPADKYKFIPEIDVYDNKVMIASWRERLGIIIESQEIADSVKTLYDLAWEEAKRLHNAASQKNTTT